jgi:mannosyltransferase OCH1-like enzyme
MIIYISVFILLILIIIIIIHSIYNYYSPYKQYNNSILNDHINKLKDTCDYLQDTPIPKIVHKIAPHDKTKWRPIWIKSYNSWLKYFPEPEYKIMMWNDDDIYIFIKNTFPWFYHMFCDYPHNIQRFDIVRYFLLYEYGGIYADMDYEVFKNFHHLLPNGKVSIIEEGNRNSKSLLENALMASPPKNIFWADVLKLAIIRTTKIECISNNFSCIFNICYIMHSTGPYLVSKVYNDKYKTKINVLDKKLYNSHHLKNKNKDIIGIHYWSGSWILNTFTKMKEI